MLNHYYHSNNKKDYVGDSKHRKRHNGGDVSLKVDVCVCVCVHTCSSRALCVNVCVVKRGNVSVCERI